MHPVVAEAAGSWLDFFPSRGSDESLLRACLLVAALLLTVPDAAAGNATVRTGACPPGLAGTCLFYTGAGDEFDAYDFTADSDYFFFNPVRLDDLPSNALGASIS